MVGAEERKGRRGGSQVTRDVTQIISHTTMLTADS